MTSDPGATDALAASEGRPNEGQRSRQRLLRWGIRLWLAGALLFLIVAVFAGFFDRFPGDEAVAGAFQDVDPPVLGGFLEFINWIGTGWVYILFTLGLAVVLAIMRAGWESLLVLYTAGVRAGNSVLKDWIERPRPSEELVEVTEHASGFSFPSGHTVGTTALFAAVFIIIPVVVSWRPLRWLLQAGCLLAVLAAGPARVYVGVHWPSDVLAAYVLVLLALGPPLVAYRMLR
ncbi:MAG: phosphatase PAP2 family protein [Chloroflexi bacterium]|nr:phosphatase PAP2 family protein [Chloroflexota bacterium]